MVFSEQSDNNLIKISVLNDKDDMIKYAFTKVLTDNGFKVSGQDDVRYKLEVELILTQLDTPNIPVKFVKYVVNANLTDTNSNVVIIPFMINGREGHATFPMAENRVVTQAAKKIISEFPTHKIV
jgi:uncharacterized lipoprotein YajG